MPSYPSSPIHYPELQPITLNFPPSSSSIPVASVSNPAQVPSPPTPTEPTMKPAGRDKNALARQQALNMYRAPNATRFALGKILLMFEDGAVRWADRRLRGLSRDRYRVYHAFGTSMCPTYDPADSITGNMYGIKKRIPLSELQRGMYCSFVSHTGTDHGYGKRIIALPGDIVRTRPDCVHNRYVKVPPGYLWVEGDAGAGKSYDSNHFGPIAAGNCVGVVQCMLYPSSMRGPVQWHAFRDQIHRERIVTDPRQQKALEAGGAHRLDFVAKWEQEGRIIQQLLEQEGKSQDEQVSDLVAAGAEKAAQFLREASAKRAQMRAAKAKAKAGTSGKQDDFFLEQWHAHGGRLRLLEDDANVVVITLPSSISEDDRRVLEKKAAHTEAKTGCSYQFNFLG